MSGRPSVAVVGVGAIGAFFAAHLIDAESADVTLCVRTPFRELVVDSVSSGTTLRCEPPVVTDPAAIEGPVDWVLLATKAHQTRGTAAWLETLAGPATKVVVMQNGVEHVERVRPLLRHGETEVVPAVVYCGVEQVAPGHVLHRTNGFVIVPSGATSSALAHLYADSRAGVRLTDDFMTAQWQKLCANVVANGITALTEQRMEVMRRDDLATLGRALIEECVAVARAEGALIDDGYAELVVGGIGSMPDGAGTSMLYDRLARRPLEHDAKYGAVVRAGHRHGLPTPLHDAFVALLGAISDASS